VGIFSKKSKTVACPMCSEELPLRQNKLMHYASHAIRTDAGDYGYKCGCGEADGYWPTDVGAAAGMADHFAKRHGISQSVSLGQ